MKKTIFLLCLFVLVPVFAFSAEIVLLNTKIFGAKLSSPITVLEPHGKNATKPDGVFIDTDASVYKSATVYYPDSVRFDQLKDELKTKYGEPKMGYIEKRLEMALWRVETERFAVQLLNEERGSKVIYIQFEKK